MRVLHVLDHSAPLQSGYVTRSLGVFAAQEAMGWTPVGLTTPRHERALRRAAAAAPREERAGGRRFLRTPDSRGGFPALLREMSASYRRILQAASEDSFDVIHAHSPALNALPTIQAGRRLGLPVVYEIRAFWEDAAVDSGRLREGGLRWRLQRRMEEAAVRSSDAAAVICEGLKSDLVARGFAPERLTLLPNAVRAADFPSLGPRDPEAAAALGLGAGPIFGFAGSFYAYEGLDLLIEALPEVRQALPGARLLLMGGGPEEEALRRLAAPLGEAVVFTGRLAREELRRRFAALDAVVLPRRAMRLTHLTTPLKPLEAMALGRPVAASDVGGHKELIRDGETGRLFPAGDRAALVAAMVETARDWRSGALEAQIETARAEVLRERDWAAAGPRYAALYAEAARRRAARTKAPLPAWASSLG
ncbi:TIGR04063 family PEP-CTERM/XrtA system glycosyltransferase [Neomegalonema perideroedes]|uniref:TIGR04063 family PEP-CTERM/XrtA system glycosyltransferase n=1 Tax=Neomegalonema perideroedes TaxID=217219 RepID=UPI00037F1946|nr:TIGR04063 family PEP-CTERM/XrtA system glycosyltransferase [Neomegalonema perideroedes]